MGISSGYNGAKLAAPLSAIDAISAASSSAPAPPSAQWVQSIALTPLAAATCLIRAISASVSEVKRLIPTTTGTPKDFTFSICLTRLQHPSCNASRFSLSKSSLVTPPCIFSARVVATITDASGAKPAARHLISKNFSAPKSAPNPASVTT